MRWHFSHARVRTLGLSPSLVLVSSLIASACWSPGNIVVAPPSLMGSAGTRASSAVSTATQATASPSDVPASSSAPSGAASAAAAPSPSASVPAAPAATTKLAVGALGPGTWVCRYSLPPETSELLFAHALQAMALAGEHPTAAQVDLITKLLSLAATSGHLRAQQQYGNYVFGYWATDEMFWPRQREVAVEALAMLRVAARNSSNHEPLDELSGPLARDPVRFKSGDFPAPPAAWVSAAVALANEWEKCHPQQPSSSGPARVAPAASSAEPARR